MHLGMFGVTVSEEPPTARIHCGKVNSEDEGIPENEKTTKYPVFGEPERGDFREFHADPVGRKESLQGA